MRVAHRHRADLHVRTCDLERIHISLARRLEGQRGWVEIRHTHVHGHHFGTLDASANEPRGAVHGDAVAGRGLPAAMEEGGDTARTVPALFDLDAIRIEDAIE